MITTRTADSILTGADSIEAPVESISLYDLLMVENLPIIAIKAVLDGFKLRAYDAPTPTDRYWYLTTTRGMCYRTRANGEEPQRWSKSEWVDIPLSDLPEVLRYFTQALNRHWIDAWAAEQPEVALLKQAELVLGRGQLVARLALGYRVGAQEAGGRLSNPADPNIGSLVEVARASALHERHGYD
ncbi:MAG TPA: hypothetical protein VFO07_08995 [Roseiflexaceae bacterium]|nr:hypothetical protein [Roseiflexaceae bacterium]